MKLHMSVYIFLTALWVIVEGCGALKKSLVKSLSDVERKAMLMTSLFLILLGLWGAIILFITWK